MQLKLLVDGVLAEEIDNRELVLPLLHRLDRELARRGEIYREPGVHDSPGHLDSGRAAMPGLLLSVEDLSGLFFEDDRISQEASQLIDRFVRQGQVIGLVVKVN